jgi:hypothetical protein
MEYLLFTDETNQRPAQDAMFFIYGGLIIPSAQLKELDNLIETARNDNNFCPGDKLKFDTRSRPSHVSIEQHRAAKKAVIDACLGLGIRFVACLVLHEIASNKTIETLISWGANSVLCAFDRFLEEENATGICILDRVPFNGDFRYLEEKFQTGLIFSPRGTKRLERVHLFAFSCQGASHVGSAIDIILGAFRYCVNERERNQAARNLLAKIIRMMWHVRENNLIRIREYGLLFRPKEVKVQAYKRQYDDFIQHLRTLLANE